MKVYLFVVGDSVKAYASLSRLCKENGIDKISKKDLPAKILGSGIKILEIEVDERV